MQRSLVRSAFFMTVSVLIAGAAAAQQARGNVFILGGEPVPGLRGFSVALVQGDLKAGTPIGDTVPAAAAKALADLKDFLPYKSYRLLDTQWTMGAGRMTGRLRGPDGKEYDLELQARHGTDDTTLAVSRFVLREVTSNQQGQGQQGQQGQQSQQGQQGQTGQQGGQRGSADRTTALFEKGLLSQTQLQRGRGFGSLGVANSVIDTSFNMDLGETVVVGTSRLQGDTALIVLLTAVARADRPARGR